MSVVELTYRLYGGSRDPAPAPTKERRKRMALKGLPGFQRFDLEGFLEGKRLVYLKAIPWEKDGQEVGSKVILQILEDNTIYQKAGTNNFGEQMTIKVRDQAPSTYGN